MNKNSIYGLIGIAVLELIAIIALAIQIQNQKISPNILRLTEPVNSLNGTVTNVFGNTISVALIEKETTAPVADTSKITPSPTPTRLTYYIVVDKGTNISRQLSSPAMLFSPNQMPKTKPSIKDVVKGEGITVQTAADLRTLSGNRVSAVSIVLPPAFDFIQGTIIKLGDDTVTLRTSVENTQKDYVIGVTRDTEISNYVTEGTGGNTKQTPKKYDFTDLKPQMQVSIWTAGNITSEKAVTATRIEPFISVPATAPVTTPLTSPTPVQKTATVLP